MTNFKRGQCRNIVSPTYQVFGQFFLKKTAEKGVMAMVTSGE